MHRIIFFIAATLIVTTPNICFSQSLPKDISNIQRRGNLRVAIVKIQKTNRPPFFSKSSSGEYYGFDIDLAKKIATELGVKVKLVYAKSFDHTVDLVASRNADVAISMLTANLRRAKKVSFTDPYYNIPQMVAINRLSASRKKINFLKSDHKQLNTPNVSMGVLQESSFEDIAKIHFSNSKIKFYASVDQMKGDLLSGKIDSVLCDQVMINNWIHTNPSIAVDIATTKLMDLKDPIAIAVNWQDTHLLRWLNLYLSTMLKQSTIDLWDKKYL